MKRMNWIKIGISLVALGAIGFFLSRLFISQTSPVPPTIGEKNGMLSPCPNTPNCVSTQHGQGDGRMESLSFSGSEEAAREKLIKVIREMPRSTIKASRPGYIHAEFRSAALGFVDDVEFVFDSESSRIDYRAAARLGYSDLGVNRQRMEAIQTAFAAD